MPPLLVFFLEGAATVSSIASTFVCCCFRRPRTASTTAFFISCVHTATRAEQSLRYCSTTIQARCGGDPEL